MTPLLLAAALLVQADPDLHRRVSTCGVEVLVGGRLSGSGWIADAEGHVVTAAHVVWKRKGKLEIRLPSGARQEASRVAFDLGHDLALVRLPLRDTPWTHLGIAKEPPPPASRVFAYGSPQFRHGFLLPGRIARKGTAYEYLADLGCAVQVIHIAGTAPSGMSGGCWVDEKGRVVGNQSGGITIQGHPTGISFAAPADAIARLVKTRTSARTVDAGITVEELDEHGAAGLKDFPADVRGVLGVICGKDGPAAEAGLKPNFIIASVNGRIPETRDDFYREIRGRKPGDRIRLTVVRKGKETPEEVSVILRGLEP